MSADLTEPMQYAKQLYLYGDGNSKPIKNIAKLALEAGVSERGIRQHLAEWRKTSTELALNNPNSPYSLQLSEETLIQHKEEITFLGKQVLKLRKQLKELDVATSNYHVVLNSYERALTKWEKSSGIMAHYATAEAAMKEKARAHERARGKESVDVKNTPRKIDTTRFQIEG